ncbi:MAG TPA: TonB family protein [Lacunisphaera sp.]|nr:TonB family protein [Lacunisphaera sp.]
MKSPRLIAFLSALAFALPASAAFESAKIGPGNTLPQYPSGLTLLGITKGYAVVAVSIDAEGKVQDTLVLAYTQPQLARAAREAVSSWTFIPARLDGSPVPVRTELRFDFTVEGAVISSNITNHFMFDAFDQLGDGAPVYRPGRIAELDRMPERLAGESPRYALQAAKAGIRGKVEVHFYIDEQGGVRLPAVSAGTDLYLMEQALAAVRNWRFAPPTAYGRPVLVAAAQEFDFGDAR